MAVLAFDAFVFDLDGVLTDTEVMWDEVRRELAAQDGQPWPDAATQAMMGMSTSEWSAYLADTVGLDGSAADAARRTIEAMQRRYQQQLPLMPGAVAAVHRMARSLPLGLASSSPRVLIDEALTQMGVLDLFTVTVSTEEVARGKPAPDGYLRACALLGVDPGRAVCAEDSTNGIMAAAAAGMTVLAVPPQFHPPTADALALTAASLTSLDELTEELLVSLP
ncbi:MAG: HAD family hydrolase [Micrococcales bacterium]|nr:MAG: HAD family hydrolase [Micrococcales bacterium]